MGAWAREMAEWIRPRLEKDDTMSLQDLERNLTAFIQNAAVHAENTAEVQTAAADVDREVRLYLQQTFGVLGMRDQGPGAEAQRQRAIAAACRFEAVLDATEPSARARALGA